MRSEIQTAPTPSPEEISEELDAALAKLSESDRSLLSLRYLKGLTTNETAASLAISTEAAAKRISRAVARLRQIMLRAGTIAPTIALPEILEHLPRAAAPAHLVATVISAAAGGAATTAGFTIAQGVTHMMAWTKIKLAIFLAAMALLATGAGIGSIKLLADDTNTAPPPPLPAPGQVVINPTSAKAALSNGVSIEIAGICESPAQGKQWWDAGGAPLPTSPYTRLPNASLSSNPGYIPREFAIKINHHVNNSPDPATVFWNFVNSGGSTSAQVVNSLGQPVKGIDGAAILVHDDPNGATFHATIAAGPWTTVVTDNSGGSMTESIGNMQFIFSTPFRVGNETHIVVAAIGLNNQDTRLLVIDRAGHQHPADSYTSANSSTGFVAEYGIRMPKNSIKECQLQARPFDQWVEIKNISLHPDQATTPQTTTSDDKK